MTNGPRQPAGRVASNRIGFAETEPSSCSDKKTFITKTRKCENTKKENLLFHNFRSWVAATS
jgi:hypothetical protein